MLAFQTICLAVMPPYKRRRILEQSKERRLGQFPDRLADRVLHRRDFFVPDSVFDAAAGRRDVYRQHYRGIHSAGAGAGHYRADRRGPRGRFDHGGIGIHAGRADRRVDNACHQPHQIPGCAQVCGSFHNAADPDAFCRYGGDHRRMAHQCLQAGDPVQDCI